MGLTDRSFHLTISTTLRAKLTDPELPAERRERLARFARKLADIVKRLDPRFCYEWFYGLCGLDPWGDLIELNTIERQTITLAE